MAWQVVLADEPVADSGPAAVRVEVLRDGESLETHDLVLDVVPATADLEQIRWYLEDFPSDPYDPSPQLAGVVRQRLASLGAMLREALLASAQSGDLESALGANVAHTELRISSKPGGLPWELMGDARGVPVSVAARQMVRVARWASADWPDTRTHLSASARILIVVSRPAGPQDVRFQAVARPLLATLQRVGSFDVEVLRPATYSSLLKYLDAAWAEGRPVDLVHFDGHGVTSNGLGHLVFEGDTHQAKGVWIPGRRLGADLAAAGVSMAVLNACRSAYAQAGTGTGAVVGSLAEQLVAAGLSGVAAMQYDVTVGTASRMVGPLYESLGNGATVGEAATQARRSLHEEMLSRRAAGDVLALDDWCVPVAYVASHEPFLTGAPPSPPTRDLRSDPRHGAAAPFVGRDEDLLALDRAFDAESAVVLSGLVGAGKSALADQFARWYEATGGAPGGVVRVSCLVDAADALLDAWGGGPEAAVNGVLVIAESLNATPFEERDRFMANLDRLAAAGAKVLITSHAATWVTVARQLQLGALGSLDALELLSSELGHPLDESALAAWRPILDCAAGNPLALQTLVGWASQLPEPTAAALRDLVDGLLAGRSPTLPEAAELAVSLWPGLVISREEWDLLIAVLHHQGYLELDHLRLLASTDNPAHLPELASTDAETWLRLASRCCATGLMSQAHRTYFTMHPLLPAAVAAHSQLDETMTTRWERAWVTIACSLGISMLDEYERGSQRHRTLRWAATEELNLRYALDRALARGWWDLVDGVASGLSVVYQQSGRTTEWRDVVERLAVEATTADGGAAAEKGELWIRVAVWKQEIHRAAHNLPSAIDWGDRLVSHWRAELGTYNLAIALLHVGISRCLAGDDKCVLAFDEALGLIAEDEHDRPLRAVLEFNLGLAYQDIPAIKDPEAALGCFRRSLHLQDPRDSLNRGKCAGQIAQLLLLAAEDAAGDGHVRARRLEEAMEHNALALQLLPGYAVHDRAIALARLGNLHQLHDRWPEAIDAHRAARAAYEASGDSTGQARMRLAIAEDLHRLGRPDEARTFALAARAAFKNLGELGTAGLRRAEKLLRTLEGPV